MKNNKEIFVRHDEVRFGEYLGAVERGEKKIASQALLPHHLVRETYSFLDESASSAAARTTEAQWAAYVESLRKSGTLDSSMAVCDVSGSMSGEPMEVAIALSLLTSQISQPPFNKVIITFSEKPQIHHIKGSTLTAMVTDIMQTESGLNTNFQAVFEKILGLAKENKLKAEDMIKVLFVFSDMEFDEARGERTDLEPFTNYNVVKRMYEREGYVLPQIVFWNLRGGRGVVSKPVLASQSGVAMISGFSGMLMKVFLEGGDLMKELNPVRVLEKSINTKAFSKLKVID
uniref:VWFA domain-containing protein n=1 Tax=Arcella intermedia TaxID=1963864 RepID=A0A6B2LBR1_9EUKA